MYETIFAKSFSKYERKRFGFCAFFLSLIVALSICSTFKPRLHPLSIIDNAANLQVTTINASRDMVIVDDMSASSQPTATETTKIEPFCSILEPMADYCEIEGDVRIHANSSTVFFVTTHINSLKGNSSWHVKPYARKANFGAMKYVKNWTVKLAENKDDIPMCTKNHSFPAILFSVGGFSGNHFHDISDMVIPLYSTSLKFERDVHFLTTDTKPWWVSKFRGLLNKLTRHEIINIDKEKEVHCYTKVVVGLKSHKELIIDPSISQNNGLSMHNFRQFLRQTYSLERTKAIELKKDETKRPRLMIISRTRTRLLTNEAEITTLARKMGFEVIVDEANHSTNLSRFAQMVNSCDVLMGVHGAGLTNMVFLPDNAVLIQIVPLGGIDGFARTDFGEPSDVFKDPRSFHIKGWDALRKTYLDQQNVTVDLHRFKGTLAKAMRILHH
ncbi:O-linked-mannose beta-1,4-N-acetylglucosaminyltransferase 2-like [Olea europaea subsp. europaea]|uniref:O-linked-mannose beta-1,4-N-acetylglucosaminyltransferase 2-like n=1 Tax=Olea europaea subsp. europaea TaxID=158383 RepID=A0A8S0QMC9_OLEEU|nr:O-linked-mannose beta-1,4-N-acetylglucosaminyltransferase 2-like [Olea europaea subsp. europaea]